MMFVNVSLSNTVIYFCRDKPQYIRNRVKGSEVRLVEEQHLGNIRERGS